MNSVSRQVCLAAGGAVLGHHDDVARIMEIPRSYFVPEATDATRQHVTKFIHCRRSAPSIDEHIVELDLLRRKAESAMQMGAEFPEFVSISGKNNAELPPPGKIIGGGQLPRHSEV